jgi:hypothetical protein
VVEVGGVPVVDVGLGQGGRDSAAFIEPGQEQPGLGELLGRGLAAVRGQRARRRPVAEPGKLRPGRELAQQPGLGLAIELGELAVQPGLVVQQLLVDGRQRAAGHQQGERHHRHRGTPPTSSRGLRTASTAARSRSGLGCR